VILERRVTGGIVRGVHEGGTVAWRGIPYAAPPIGRMRFRAPGPVVGWPGVRSAIAFGDIAPQTVQRLLRGAAPITIPSSEDCLTVNVQTPSDESEGSALLPVMVFIHGGGYSAGSSREFSGQAQSFVLTRRVIYVSFNYRLGPFGYLDFTRYSTVARPMESNLGLRDQVAVLRWVRENIRQFGGDPARVTVFGESAGGNAVTTLLATPSARGLFAHAIAQSSPPSAVYPPALTATWAGEYLDILRRIVTMRARREGTEEEALVVDQIAGASAAEFLNGASVEDLLAASLVLQVRTPDAYPGAFCLAPVIDGVFLPEYPMTAIREGRAHRVPLIIGTNDREGSIFRGRVDILPRTPTRIRALFSRAPAASRALMYETYPGLPARRPAADFSGDYGFWYPTTRVADFHSEFAPVHVYRFDFAPRLLKLVGLDATHGVEMFALFDQLDVPLARAMTSLGGSDEYASAGERMRQHWLDFAEGGVVSETWPAYRLRSRSTLIIDRTDRVEIDPRRNRRRAWRRFLPQFN
jgi:para-nitrobenzyl esterase